MVPPKRDAARTRPRTRGIGPWRPEAGGRRPLEAPEGVDRKEGRPLFSLDEGKGNAHVITIVSLFYPTYFSNLRVNYFIFHPKERKKKA